MRITAWPDFAADIDRQLDARDHFEALRPTMFHWSATVRIALGLAAHDLARRLGISQPAVTKLEAREAAGTISIERLIAIADALECDFVYGFIPRHSFAESARKNKAKHDAARKAHRKLPRL